MKFTHAYLFNELETFLVSGYEFITMEQYYTAANITPRSKVATLRIDVDFSLRRLKPLLSILKTLSIKSTIFVRLHAPEYNPFDFEGYRIMQDAIENGHEIGYHSEIVDQGIIWNESPDTCLTKDLCILEKLLDITIHGIASHGGKTNLNNLSFWEHRRPEEFGLKYEAYSTTNGKNAFSSGIYVSDSEDIRWKSYKFGKLMKDNSSPPSYFATEQHPFINILIHPDVYYTYHPYE
ncbi:hypothetical protein N9448_08465 [Litorivicinus sp.]|nr:hypothetical protein [Litorivicinus sp.]